MEAVPYLALLSALPLAQVLFGLHWAPNTTPLAAALSLACLAAISGTREQPDD